MGQGGFHATFIRGPETRFTLVYDCGSNQSTARSREIDAFVESTSAERPIDVLALSHLDHDHVNGVEWLLAQREARDVVLPYLSDTERLIGIAKAAASGQLTPSYYELATDPAGFFLGRGVQRVIFAMAPNDDQNAPEEGPTDLPPPFDQRKERTTRPQVEGPIVPDGAGVFRLPGGTSLTWRPTHTSLWRLLPFVHPWQSGPSKFLKALKKLLGTKTVSETLEALRTALKDRTVRRQMANLYTDHFWRDRNLSSMALYSGPAHRLTLSGYRAQVLRGARPTSFPFINPYADQPGWLGSGDAQLSDAGREQRFGEFYSRLLPSVGTFVLPHHGARHNFRGDSLEPALDPFAWVFAKGPNDYGHPHRPLLTSLGHRGGTVVGATTRGAFVEHLDFDLS